MEQSKFYQIKNVTEHEYTLVGCDGSVITRQIQDVDKSASAFTIQDTKDGDVLAAHECLVLFKEIDGLDIRCYCTYHYMNHQAFYVDTLQNKTAFHPATKEQRDLLFQKMKESGYEWDAEKKELKKIEQKSADKKGMNIVEEDMTPFQKKVFCIIDTTIEEEQGLKQVCDELLRLAHDESMQNPAWSEEDETYLDHIITAVKLYYTDYKGEENPWRNELLRWLKSIRPQNKWKPSDEQMEALYTYIYNPQYFNSPDPRMELVESVYKDLKKLKE